MNCKPCAERGKLVEAVNTVDGEPWCDECRDGIVRFEAASIPVIRPETVYDQAIASLIGGVEAVRIHCPKTLPWTVLVRALYSAAYRKKVKVAVRRCSIDGTAYAWLRREEPQELRA